MGNDIDTVSTSTGSYGAALSRYLLSQGITVVEVDQPDEATRQRRGNSDIIDAEAAARAVISGRATAAAKASDGPGVGGLDRRVFVPGQPGVVHPAVQVSNARDVLGDEVE
ncbi:hypothetical protein GCM10010347_42760 [Streptomyces cirratus]|uniref:Uncharacterized protein n=1 Tax=Streptomyces cirratus TaxID=68187 RepID=A0ABQ3EW81_9ACTN|nr:hypothetical protein [Streptomyces cirratus]GHB68086.1 hypothetical protein GCM10010347_42760 [Streptomyces cirratus]